MLRFTRTRARELRNGEIEVRIRLRPEDATAFLAAFPQHHSAHFLEPVPGPKVTMNLVTDLEEHEDVIQIDVGPVGKPPTQTVAPVGSDTSGVGAPPGITDELLPVWEAVMRACSRRWFQEQIGVDEEPTISAFEGPAQVAVRLVRRRLEAAADPGAELRMIATVMGVAAASDS